MNIFGRATLAWFLRAILGTDQARRSNAPSHRLFPRQSVGLRPQHANAASNAPRNGLPEPCLPLHSVNSYPHWAFSCPPGPHFGLTRPTVTYRNGRRKEIEINRGNDDKRYGSPVSLVPRDVCELSSGAIFSGTRVKELSQGTARLIFDTLQR